MKNKFGLDAAYFKKNLLQLIENIEHYTPEEMERILTKLASIAHEQKTKNN